MQQNVDLQPLNSFGLPARDEAHGAERPLGARELARCRAAVERRRYARLAHPWRASPVAAGLPACGRSRTGVAGVGSHLDGGGATAAGLTPLGAPITARAGSAASCPCERRLPAGRERGGGAHAEEQEGEAVQGAGASTRESRVHGDHTLSSTKRAQWRERPRREAGRSGASPTLPGTRQSSLIGVSCRPGLGSEQPRAVRREGARCRCG